MLRSPLRTGSTNRSGRMTWGAAAQSTSRSVRLSRTRRNSRCSRYLSPPWISFDEAEEVSPARSRRSSSSTLQTLPRRVAGDSGSIDAAADDDQIDRRLRGRPGSGSGGIGACARHSTAGEAGEERRVRTVRTEKYRRLPDRRLDQRFGAARQLPAAPEMAPPRARGQVHAPPNRARLDHGRDEKIRTEKIARLIRIGVRVVFEVQEQRPLQRQSRRDGLGGERAK